MELPIAQPVVNAATFTAQAAEDFIVHLFEDSNLCAIHAGRVTISEHCRLKAAHAAAECRNRKLM